jgi:hypothetical protein
MNPDGTITLMMHIGRVMRLEDNTFTNDRVTLFSPSSFQTSITTRDDDLFVWGDLSALQSPSPSVSDGAKTSSASKSTTVQKAASPITVLTVRTRVLTKAELIKPAKQTAAPSVPSLQKPS